MFARKHFMLKINTFYSLLFLFVSVKCVQISPGEVRRDTYHGLRDIENSRILDPSIDLRLEWNVKRNSNSILFRISAKYISQVTIGFTRKGRVDGGDFVGFGLDYNGQPYIYDMYGVTNGTLISDAKQDWKIVHFDSSVGPYQTIITISRDMDTCDKQDMILNDDLTHLVWDYSFNILESKLAHFVAKGIMPIYLLDPEIPPLSLSNDPSLEKWTFARTIQLPARHTTYWCSIQRAPRLATKHHIVGFAPHFRDELSERHVHHQNVFRCVAPPGVDPVEVFERFASHPGHECYLEERPVIPVHLCRQIVHLWGVAGTAAQLPNDVGFPLGEEPNEFFMLETHYNNPDVRDDLVLENGVNFFHTPRVRTHDGGMIFVGYGVISDPTNGGLFAIPPQTSQFTIAGQCSPQCLSDMLPSTGVKVFAVTLHAHVSTLKMRLRHFRSGKELPVLQREEAFDFNFQQMRLLPVPVTLLPGDHLVTECVYSTSWKNGSTVSGFSTRDEMCNAFIYLNKQLPYMHCSSEFPSRKISSILNIQNMRWELSSYERIVTSAVANNLVGLKFSQVVDQVQWNSSMKRDLEREMLSTEHIASCPTTYTLAQQGLSTAVPTNGNVAHPKPFPSYKPASSCPTTFTFPSFPQEVSLTKPDAPKGWTLSKSSVSQSYIW